MFCPKCGMENHLDQKYCRGCGHALAGHKFALENNFEDEVEKIKSGSTALGVSAVTVILISLMALGVWISQKDAGVFFTLLAALAIAIPGTIVGLVRLNRAYRALSHTDRGNRKPSNNPKRAPFIWLPAPLPIRWCGPRKRPPRSPRTRPT
jgi:hypothetical protein